jgi:hypothetical protein
MKYKAQATTGEEVQGKYIHSENLQGFPCEYRIEEESGLQHDINIETLKVLHKGKYKPVNWNCDVCGMLFFSGELHNGAEIDPPYFCEECENLTIEQANVKLDNLGELTVFSEEEQEIWEESKGVSEETIKQTKQMEEEINKSLVKELKNR